MLDKTILLALEEMESARKMQITEISAPSHGVKYPVVARNTVMIEYAKRHAGIAPSTSLRHYKGPLKELRSAILATGVSQPTLWQWTRKYTNIIAQAKRYNVGKD
jgi:hypothetical protein